MDITRRRKKVELIQIQQKDLKDFRHKQWLLQDKKCAASNVKIAFEHSVVDHCHLTKAEVPGVDGKGLIRGVLHFGVNALEGKITNAYRRNGLSKVAPLGDILRGLANYLEKYPVQNTLHPSCIRKIKKKKLNKTDIKRVLKFWSKMYPKRKPPKPTMYVTKEWQGYIELSKKYRDKK